MTREHDSRSQGQQHPRGDDGGGGGPARDPRILQIRQMAHAASVYNKAHSELAAEFTKLTGIDSQSFRAVRAWQLRHGQRGDGKIGPRTVEAARAEAKQPDSGASAGAGASVVSFSDEEAGSIDVGSDDANREVATDGGDLAEEIVGGGVTGSEAHRPKQEGEAAEEAGRTLSEGVDHGLEGAPDLEGHELGVRGVAQIARLPHVVHLVKEKKYEEALRYISETLGWSDAVEVIKATMEYAGIELSNLEVVAELALKFPKIARVTRFTAAGATAADIVLVGVEFQMEAIKALAEAKEAGERDNTIYLYATAWANGFLNGAYSNPGAVDEKQQKAVADGLREGKMTAGNLGERAPEIARKLIAKYGDEKNIERALVDVLIKRAGIEGLRFHQ